jgi:hypothetical protein
MMQKRDEETASLVYTIIPTLFAPTASIASMIAEIAPSEVAELRTSQV